MENNNIYNNLIDLLKIVIPSFITLAASYIGYLYGIRHYRRQKKYEFIETQINKYYSPLVGYRKKIESISNSRVELFKATDATWKELCKNNPNPTENDIKQFDNSIKYDNKQFAKDVLPTYDKMITIMHENYYLANYETKEYYETFFIFVDIWHRFLEDSIPRETISKLNHKEENLKPFYDDLNNQLNKLIEELKSYKKQC